MGVENIIGIVGGVGPYAGLDLARKIMDQTQADRDQQHLSVALLSLPQRIEDRTSFLLNQTNSNPAQGILEAIRMLNRIGCNPIGIPCNTAHVPKIFEVILEGLKQQDNQVKLLHMIREVARFMKKHYPTVQRIGVLSTIATWKSRIYPSTFEPENLQVLSLNESLHKDLIHESIYNPEYGIKAQSNPVTETARSHLLEAIHHLQHEGAEAIVLGCTEIPLAVFEKRVGQTPIIDATAVLARALIREVDSSKLKPYHRDVQS